MAHRGIFHAAESCIPLPRHHPNVLRAGSSPVIPKVDSFRREKTSHQFDGLTTNSPPKQATYRGFFSALAG